MVPGYQVQTNQCYKSKEHFRILLIDISGAFQILRYQRYSFRFWQCKKLSSLFSTTAIYIAVKIFNAMSSLVRLKTQFLLHTLKNALAFYNAGAEGSFKFRSRRIGSRLLWKTVTVIHFKRLPRVKTKFCRGLGAILNFTPGPLGWTWPQGWNEMFTPLFTPGVEHSLLFRRMERRTENFTPRGQSSPLGSTSTLGSKFAPFGAKFGMGLWGRWRPMNFEDKKTFFVITHLW
jgi:hypothetical protein